MRSIDRFVSQFDRLALSLKPGESLDRQISSRFCAEFSSLLLPVIGRKAAADLFYRTLERSRLDTVPQKLGAMAAFFLGEFEDIQSLNKEDLEDIRETLKEVSREINLSALTTLMGELLARGQL